LVIASSGGRAVTEHEQLLIANHQSPITNRK
jgi:hypothetical protein